MGEFFKFTVDFLRGLNWRRKVALRLWVLTLIVTVGWIRSLNYFDEIRFHTGADRTDALLSTDSSIGWETTTGFAKHRSPSLSFAEFYLGQPIVDISGSMDLRQSRWDWKRYCCGFAIGTAVRGYRWDDVNLEHHTVWIVPYWSIVFPLTLLTAYLFLVKLQWPNRKDAAQHAK
jgi:hypothetical protein